MGLSLKVSDNSLETQEFLESPKPLLSKSKENLLSARQKEAILGLEELIKEGYPQLTMSQIANKLKVSLRTLYKIAPKKRRFIINSGRQIVIQDRCRSSESYQY
jgi:hypothetical protein